MRTVIAPLSPEVEAELAALDARLQRRGATIHPPTRVQPHLGYRLRRGHLAEEQCRAVRFDRDNNPDDLFGGRRIASRTADEDPSSGPRWRIVFWPAETKDREVRLIVVLTVGIAHPRSGNNPPSSKPNACSKR